MNTTATAPLFRRLSRSVVARVNDVRGSQVLSAAALRESWTARSGGHPVEENHRAHLVAALEWLARAQDAIPDYGFARGYSLTWNSYFGGRGWQPSYPETTGYTIPTLYSAARLLNRPELATRAQHAAQWEVEVQLPSGAVQGGVIGQPPSPAVFNTGQVILGWLAAHEETGGAEYAEAARRAGRYLVSTQGADGHWSRGNSHFARSNTTAYNARTAWALAEAGARLNEPSFTEAAARNLHAVAASQHTSGWFPQCCLNDPDHPLLHTLAYTTRGLLEGGRVLEDERLIANAERAAEPLARCVREDGWMPGRLDAAWTPAVEWSCLTGEAQMANIWLRLHEITGGARWLEPVPRVLRFLKGTQNRTTSKAGVRGGIMGAAPVSGEYGRFEVLNWATKFFADALMRHEAALARAKSPVAPLA